MSNIDHDTVYFVRYDASGNIEAGGSTRRVYFEQEKGQGSLVLETDTDMGTTYGALKAAVATYYVNLSDPEQARLAERQPYPYQLSPNPVAARSEAALPNLPPCTVRYAGPVAGAFEHAGGTLNIGFSVPGNYTISFDALPYLPANLTLTVTQ